MAAHTLPITKFIIVIMYLVNPQTYWQCQIDSSNTIKSSNILNPSGVHPSYLDIKFIFLACFSHKCASAYLIINQFLQCVSIPIDIARPSKAVLNLLAIKKKYIVNNFWNCVNLIDLVIKPYMVGLILSMNIIFPIPQHWFIFPTVIKGIL